MVKKRLRKTVLSVAELEGAWNCSPRAWLTCAREYRMRLLVRVLNQLGGVAVVVLVEVVEVSDVVVIVVVTMDVVEEEP